MLHCGCSLLQMLNLFFFIITIMILHGEVAVNDISAFYLPHFTFFMSFKMFLARFACHTAKRWKKRQKQNKTNKKTFRKINSGSEIKSRFSRSLRFKPISAKAIEEIVDNFCSLS